MSKPFTYMGITYPSRQAFCTAHGLNWATVAYRMEQGITDERLTARRIRPNKALGVTHK